MEIETNLRDFISEIIHPFHDRVAFLERETGALRTSAQQAKEQMITINEKLDSEMRLRDFLDQTNKYMLQMVSNQQLIVFCRKNHTTRFSLSKKSKMAISTVSL